MVYLSFQIKLHSDKICGESLSLAVRVFSPIWSIFTVLMCTGTGATNVLWMPKELPTGKIFGGCLQLTVILWPQEFSTQQRVLQILSVKVSHICGYRWWHPEKWASDLEIKDLLKNCKIKINTVVGMFNYKVNNPILQIMY